jgi:hypothetical protein
MKTRATLLLTSSRSVTGVIEHGDARLSDAVNNPLESVLRVSDAVLGRLGNSGGSEANGPFEVAIVPKEQIALIYAIEEQSRPAERRMSSFVAKQTTDILVLLAGLRLRGRAHASAQLDAAQFHRLVFDAKAFMVLTGASLALDVEGTTARDIGVAILNTKHIQFVARVPSAPPEAGDPRETAVRGA